MPAVVRGVVAGRMLLLLQGIEAIATVSHTTPPSSESRSGGAYCRVSPDAVATYAVKHIPRIYACTHHVCMHRRGCYGTKHKDWDPVKVGAGIERCSPVQRLSRSTSCRDSLVDEPIARGHSPGRGRDKRFIFRATDTGRCSIVLESSPACAPTHSLIGPLCMRRYCTNLTPTTRCVCHASRLF